MPPTPPRRPHTPPSAAPHNAPHHAPTAPEPATAVLRRLAAGTAPFALLRRRTPGRDADRVEVLSGPVTDLDRLAELPLPERPGAPALALVPFGQLRERGFEVVEDGTPLSVLVPEEPGGYAELPLDDVLAALPDRPTTVRDGGFDVSDAAYADLVRTVVEREIAGGEGANFVLRRTYTGCLDGFDRRAALALFRRLLTAERGAYWTFVVHTGRRTLVGASPEVHVRMSGGTVVLNPISGTHRYPPEGPSVAGLLRFLDDPKEAEELSMVVDEELKMVCSVADRGGTVVGPRLREMAHLAHTEYELRGRGTRDVREVLRETMFAATVTGSPVRNACRVIRRHERTGRGYYAGALALLGRDAGGAQTLDSPILIRTADIDPAGRLRLSVGATLVRGSRPADEVAETRAKAAGVLAALGAPDARPAAPAPAPGAPGAGGRPRLGHDPRVREALAARRADLAPFWLRMRRPGPARLSGEVPGEVLVVDAEDAFTAMLAHLLRSLGPRVTVVGHDAPGAREAALAHPGPVVLGPGPGNPSDPTDPRMRTLRGLTAALLAGHRHGVLGVCLGHELIAAELGLPVARRARPHQGAQERIDFFGRPETVGFYSSYAPHCDEPAARRLAARGVELSRGGDAGREVHALRAPGLASVQFHPESVLTLDGPRIVGDLLAGVAAGPGPRGTGPAGPGAASPGRAGPKPAGYSSSSPRSMA